MHELSLSCAVLNTAVKHAQGRRVSVVSVRVGGLRQVVPETLAFYFQFVARETVCEGALLEQEFVPARVGCAACGREWTIETPIFRCPSCGGAEVSVIGGDEFLVESIEVEQEEEACIAQR